MESRYRDAVPLLERAVTIHEQISGLDHPETVLAVRALAEVKEDLGLEHDASELLERELKSREILLPQVAPTACDDPDYFRAHEHTGSRLFSADNIDAASYHFRRAVQLRPDLGENHNNLGSVLSAKGRLDEAIKEFTEACRLAPNVPTMHVNLANAFFQTGRFAEASETFLTLLQKEPTNPVLLNNYAVTLYKLGDKEAAVLNFRKALEFNPNLKDAREGLAVALGEQPDPLAEAANPQPEK